MTRYSYKSEDEVIEAADRFDRARYWNHVRGLAKEILDEYPYDEEKQYDAAHERVDSAVIYTRDAIAAIRFTDHDDAYEEVGDLPSGKNAYELYAYIAYFALHADVLDELSRARDERKSHPRLEDTQIETWFERDRAHVELNNRFDESTIIEWWDEDVAQAVEDGFLKPKDWHRSAYDYAVSTGLIEPESES